MKSFAIFYTALAAMLVVMKHFNVALETYEWTTVAAMLFIPPNLVIWCIGLIVILQQHLYNPRFKKGGSVT